MTVGDHGDRGEGKGEGEGVCATGSSKPSVNCLRPEFSRILLLFPRHAPGTLSKIQPLSQTKLI